MSEKNMESPDMRTNREIVAQAMKAKGIFAKTVWLIHLEASDLYEPNSQELLDNLIGRFIGAGCFAMASRMDEILGNELDSIVAILQAPGGMDFMEDLIIEAIRNGITVWGV